MATDWSETIVTAQLDDEPALSDELASILDRLESAAPDAKRHVVLDFSAVTYVNSSNLAQLLRLLKLQNAARKQLRLAGLGDDVWSVMTVTGLDKIFRFAPDMLTALAGLQIEEDGGAPEA